MITENQHKPNDFTPVVAAMEHAEYVLQITQNPNWFHDFSVNDKKDKNGIVTRTVVFHEDSLTNMVRVEARQIFHLVFIANEINVKRYPWRKDERLQKQVEAISLCDGMLADIQLCRKHFHLTTKRIKYWGTMVLNLRYAIERWYESDKKRL